MDPNTGGDMSGLEARPAACCYGATLADMVIEDLPDEED